MNEQARFERDGVVCLRGVIPDAWLERLAPALEVERAAGRLADMSELRTTLDTETGDDGTSGVAPFGRFWSGVDHWRDNETLADFARNGPLGRVVADLMGARAVRLWEDSILVKEAGSDDPTTFHTDIAYFRADGDQICTTWCPLDPVSEASGAVQYVIGSHRWDRDFQPNLFVTTDPIPGTQGEPAPQFDPADPRLVSFVTEPGDVVIHHARTLHGAGPNRSEHHRRALSVRFIGDDVRFYERPGTPAKPHHSHLTAGDRLEDPAVPLVWSSGSTS